jgi:hypothetical protein
MVVGFPILFNFLEGDILFGLGFWPLWKLISLGFRILALFLPFIQEFISSD